MIHKLLFFFLAAFIGVQLDRVIMAQVGNKRGHLTVEGELQEHFTPEHRFWVNTLVLKAEPNSDLEKFLKAKVGTRIILTIKPN